MPSLKSLCAFASVVAVCLQLVACVRGSNDLPPSEPPFPTTSQDQLPAGQRIDVSAQNLFPMGAGDVWNYDILDAGGTQTGNDTRQVTSGPDASGRVVLTETEAGAPSTTTYVVSGDGLLLAAPLEEIAPASAASIVGSFFEYATPLYPQGATRRHVRSGPWGEDLDGDGIGESFRLEFSQVFLGFEPVQFSNVFSLTNVAHFRNVIQLTLRPTAPGNTDRAVTITEETWFAPNLGMVKAVRSAVDVDGVTIDPVHTIAFASATVSGVNWITSVSPPILDGQVIDVPLVHNALVYDSVRNRYYASIPGSVIGNGNSIATVEPATGQVTYSAPVGSEPNALAIAADGSVLYVGLDGSGDVVKLALPGMTEQGRTRLVTDAFFGQSHAQSIAVSPVDATVVAVQMIASGAHEGVALLRDMVMQPTRTQEFRGNNLLVFDPAGTTLYGLNNETTEFGLRRIQVLPDGLIEQLVIPDATDFGASALRFADGRVIAGSRLYNAPALTPAGRVSGAFDCLPPSTGNQLVCFAARDFSTRRLRLLLADSTTFVIGASLLAAASEPDGPRRLAQGPAGQVAISYPANPTGFVSKVLLFTSTQLLSPPTPPGVSWPVTASSTPDGQVLEVGLVHNELVYDPLHNKYYASVPGSVVGVGNSIASIDPATGQVTHSVPIGSEPAMLAISADGSVLYAGLNGSGELLKLALPSMSEQGRLRLPSVLFSGQQVVKAIAVSPVDPAVVAISMRVNAPGHGPSGPVALVRNMVMQPQTLSPFSDDSLLVFDAAGTTVYGLNTDSTAFDLRRIQVLADGLLVQQSVTAAEDFLVRNLGFANNQVIAGPVLYDAPALTLAGSIPGAADCVLQRSGSKLLCISIQNFLTGQSRILVADSGTFTIGASLPYHTSEMFGARRKLVQGPTGQVAVSYATPFAPSPPMRLFSSSQLP